MYVETSSDTELLHGLGSYRNELVRLLPELSDRAPELAPPLQSDAATEQYRLFEAVVAWLDSAAASTPLVLILDDLHWAAPPTILMLRHILRSEHVTRVFVLGTYRDSELGDTHPLTEMFAEASVSVPIRDLQLVAVGGLDAKAVEAIVEATAGYDLGDAGRQFARTLHDETDGNPFFVNEIIRSLMESGAIAGPEYGGSATTQWPDDFRVPAAARNVVLRRFARLSEDAQHTLTLAAVIGPEFDVPVLERGGRSRLRAGVAGAGGRHPRGTDRRGRGRAVHVCARHHPRRVVRPAQRESPRAIAQPRRATPSSACTRMTLRTTCPRWRTTTRTPTRTRRCSTRPRRPSARSTGSRSRTRSTSPGGAWPPSSGPADSAVRSRPRRSSSSCSRSARQSCAPGSKAGRRCCRAYELARELADPRRQAESLLAINRGFFPRVGRTDVEFVDALERAIEAQGDGETPELAQLLATLASELVWAPDGERRFELSDRATAMARRVGDSRCLASVLLMRSMTILAPDTLAERAQLLDEVRDIADELGDPAISFDNAFVHGSTGWEAGDIARINGMQEMASALAAELRQPRLEWQASSMLTARRILEGDLEAAEERAQLTQELGHRAGQHAEAFIFFTEQMLEIRRWQDRRRASSSTSRTLAGQDGIDIGYSLTRDALRRRVSTTLARTRVRGDHASGSSSLRGATRSTATTLYNLAYLACRFGDERRARDIYDALLAVRRACSRAPRSPGRSAGTTSACSPPRSASATSARSTWLGRSRPMKGFERRCSSRRRKLELARVVLEMAGRTSDATALLGDVRATAAAHGSPFLARRVRRGRGRLNLGALQAPVLHGFAAPRGNAPAFSSIHVRYSRLVAARESTASPRPGPLGVKARVATLHDFEAQSRRSRGWHPERVGPFHPDQATGGGGGIPLHERRHHPLRHVEQRRHECLPAEARLRLTAEDRGRRPCGAPRR